MIPNKNTLTSIENGELLLYRTIWNTTSDNMFIVKLDDKGDFISESCNRSQEKTFGLTPNQANGVKLKDILDEENYKLIHNRYTKCLSLKKPISYEESIVIDDTGRRYFHTTILPVINNNESRIFGISREITNIKNLEKEKLKKELEKRIIEQRKNAQMSEMIVNIAHQWRQPLSVISTAVTSIKINKELGLEEKIDDKELIDCVINNVEHLSKIIDNFRDLIEEKKESKEVVLQDRLNVAIGIVKSSLKNYNIDFKTNINSIEPLKAKIVIGELSEVIVSIINNSKDALLKNKVSTPYIKLNLLKKQKKAVITIEDNGGGINENILPKIFDPYFTTKHKSQGTGLGLHMSKEIIEKHLYGLLYATNTKNGVIFTIELPLTSK